MLMATIGDHHRRPWPGVLDLGLISTGFLGGRVLVTERKERKTPKTPQSSPWPTSSKRNSKNLMTHPSTNHPLQANTLSHHMLGTTPHRPSARSRSFFLLIMQIVPFLPFLFLIMLVRTLSTMSWQIVPFLLLPLLFLPFLLLLFLFLPFLSGRLVHAWAHARPESALGF